MRIISGRSARGNSFPNVAREISFDKYLRNLCNFFAEFVTEVYASAETNCFQEVMDRVLD